MADFLCEDFNEDDFDTNCVDPTGRTTVLRSPRYGITRRASVALVGLLLWLRQ